MEIYREGRERKHGKDDTHVTLHGQDSCTLKITPENAYGPERHVIHCRGGGDGFSNPGESANSAYTWDFYFELAEMRKTILALANGLSDDNSAEIAEALNPVLPAILKLASACANSLVPKSQSFRP